MKKYLTCIVLLMLICAACTPTVSPGQAGATPTSTSQPTEVSPSPTAPAGAAVELQFWHGQSQTQQAALNSLVDQFNASHPLIKVTAIYQGNYNDLYQKVTAAIAAGTPPDLAIAYQNQVASYIQSDAVIPLDNLIQDTEIGFTAADLQDIYPSFIDHYPLYGDQVYSMAFMRSMEVMYYDADMLQAAGFDQAPTNYDQFMSICAAATKPPDVYCYEMTPDASTFATWVFSRGGDLISSDGKAVAFDSPAGLATFQFINDLFTNNYATLVARAFQDQTDFALGKLAFTFGSTAGLPYYTQAITEAGTVKNWAIAPSPHTTPDPVVDIYGPSVTIFKTTTEKERAAFIFLKWMMDPGPNAEWIKATAYFPARRSTTKDLADFIQANPLYGDALDWVQYGRTEPALAAWEPIRNFIADAMTAIADGQETPQAALQDTVSKSNQVLASQP